MKSYKKIFSTSLKIAVSLGGLAYIFWKIPLKEAASHWSTAMLPWVALILLLTFFSMLIQANRWRGLLLDDGKKVPFVHFTPILH